jgi:hypothetical protein
VVFGRLSGNVPALIVEAAHEHWKLRAEMHCHLGSQPIAQRMQHGTQRTVSVVPVFEVKLLRERLEPGIRFLNRVFHCGDARWVHGALR